MEFDKILQAIQFWKPIVPVPTIDTFDVPQGLAGNSAYIIKPAGAKQCINAAKNMAYGQMMRLCVNSLYHIWVSQKLIIRIHNE